MAQRVREPLHVLLDLSSGGTGVALGGAPTRSLIASHGGFEILGTLPPLYPEWLGDPSFAASHGARFPYVAGEMANGIATTRMVVALAQADLMGFFGAGGLTAERVEEAVAELTAQLPGRRNWGVNLIHSPHEPRLEEHVAEILLAGGVPNISASAFMALTPAVVRCSAVGLATDRQGRVQRRTSLFAKVSRLEIAEQFMSPAPSEILRTLIDRNLLTPEEASLAAAVPVAQDVTVEADSGGHTDNRPLAVMLPAVLALRDSLTARFGYPEPIRVGAAGGLGTPQAVASAFALGADYVVTGSVNQVAVEAGLSDDAKSLLAEADVTDVTMAAAADMFEFGVKLQVLRRGTMFATRANRLYEVYRSYESLDAIPAAERATLERDILGDTLDATWARTVAYWRSREPATLERAERDPKHRMALLFRSYLGQASQWAIVGDTGRRTDYQIWCGPAMGAFNRWTQGGFLARPENRTVVQIARNLLEGAAVATRLHQLRSYGVPLPAAAFGLFRPRPLT
ncbi:MAG: PfaD family polyunsaturated fatty acid/polyketide biosynthesis protein [Frankia sp.]